MKPRIQQIEGIPTPTDADVGKSLTYKGANQFEFKQAASTVPATPTAPGTVQLATVTEVLAGLDEVKAVTAASLKAHTDMEKLERNQAILAALTGAIAPGGTGVTPEYVQNLLNIESQNRTGAIAAALTAEEVARINAVNSIFIQSKAYTDLVFANKGSTVNPNPNPNPETIPQTVVRDRMGLPITLRSGGYLEFRIPVITEPVPGTGGNPPIIVPAPVGSVATRDGTPLTDRNGEVVYMRTKPDDYVPPIVVEPTPTPTVTFPTGPYLKLNDPHGHVVIESQNGVNAVVRLVRPIYQNAQLFNVSHENTDLGNRNTFYTYKGLNDFLGIINGNPATKYDLTSLYDGEFTTQILQTMDDNTFLELNVTFKVAPNRTGAVPAATPVPNRNSVVFFEDFDPGTGTGALSNSFGNIYNTEAGSVMLLGRASAMTPPNADYQNTANDGYPNGLYEFNVRFIGDLGNAGGPCILLWPASNVWPGPEVDMGEFFANGKMYMANHWKDSTKPTDNNGQDQKTIWPMPNDFDPHVFNILGARLSNLGVIFYVNGVEFARDHFSPAPKDFANGGENHTIGLLSGSDQSIDGSPTGLECKWVRFTPESLLA